MVGGPQFGVRPFLARRWGVVVIAIAAVVGLPQALRATTFVPPRDLGQLATESAAVVLATAEGSRVWRRGDALLFTETEFRLEAVVAGELGVGDLLHVQVPGGELDGTGWRVPGAPRFDVAQTYLLFLQKNAREEWITTMLSYGVLRQSHAIDGTPLLQPTPGLNAHRGMERPDGTIPEGVGTYWQAPLLMHLADVVSGASEWDAAVAEADDGTTGDGGEAAVAAPPSACRYFVSEGRRYRWRAFDNGGTATIFADDRGDESLGGIRGFRLLAEAADLWMSFSGSGMNLVFGGPTPLRADCGGGGGAQANTVVFNDPCGEIGDLSDCSGILAFGGPLTNGTHQFDDASWVTVVGWIVVVNNGAGCLGEPNYRVMLAHELGHGLGWNHVDDDRALMFARCCRSINSTDQLCGRFTYPPVSEDNRRPRANAGGDRTLLLAGSTAPLRGSVSDDGLPGQALSTRWRQLVGPGAARFDDETALETTVQFSRSGRYLIGLEADDGELLTTDVFEADVQVLVGTERRVVFETGPDYRGTVDTFLQEAAPNANNASASELSVDSDDPGDSGLASEALLRFDGIFGDGAARGAPILPPGASIREATLELASTNLGDGASVRRMEAPWTDSESWSRLPGGGAAQSVSPVVEAIVSGFSESVLLDVTRSVAAWSADPCSNYGWAFLPRGTNGWDFVSAEGGTPPRLTVVQALVESETPIRLGDRWDYFRGLTNPPADWREPEFTPGPAWLQGPTGLGYGDGDDATTLSDMRSRYAAVFARRTFSLTAPESVSQLLLRIDYDDGFVAYLNGEEAARSRGMGSEGDPATRTTFSRESHEAGTFEEYTLPPALLLEGDNVLAIQVHNDDIDSSDLSLRPELHLLRTPLAGDAPWKFRRGNAVLPDDWNAPDFDDTDWEVGVPGIGYGDEDDITRLDDMRGNYLSVFLRREVILGAAESERDLFLTVIHDDGVVVYVNGVEVARENMPAGVIEASTAAAASIEPTATTMTIAAEHFVSGRNVVAVSVHNSSLSSTDLSFSAVLVPSPEATPGVVPCDEDSVAFRRGDVTGDEQFNLSDGVSLLNFLFLVATPPSCPDAADVDDDGNLSLTDAVVLFNFLFLRGLPPAAPGVDCGADTTEDELSACASNCQEA